jgi:hypothetical protein
MVIIQTRVAREVADGVFSEKLDLQNLPRLTQKMQLLVDDGNRVNDRHLPMTLRNTTTER